LVDSGWVDLRGGAMFVESKTMQLVVVLKVLVQEDAVDAHLQRTGVPLTEEARTKAAVKVVNEAFDGLCEYVHLSGTGRDLQTTAFCPDAPEFVAVVMNGDKP
jgi:hypothetical protein